MVLKTSQARRAGANYECEFTVAAPPERVFEALTTLRGLRGWWTPDVSGEPLDGEILFRFPGLEERIVMRVDVATPSSEVCWTCVTHDSLPEWAGTTVRFALSGSGSTDCEVAFRHAGLTPRLDCYDECEAGWDHFLASLRSYVEAGRGTPFGSEMQVQPLSVAREYHDAWTSGDFDRAGSLLAEDVVVEVPVNSYGDRAQFIAAVSAFGSMTTDVRVLADFGTADDAMLLYDMDVTNLGTMRVAEHFTVAHGRVTRLRQIHDTAALRAAGFVGSET